MNAQPRDWRIANARWQGATPLLSVLIPFKNDDPCGLVRQLHAGRWPVEIIVLDDGSDDEALAARVAATITALDGPAQFIRLGVNTGRARARNRLALEARGRHLLFLDSDMAPDRDDFLDRWCALAQGADPAVAFGGITLHRAPRTAGSEFHRALALAGDCVPVERRRLAPEKHVFTSNLLVRRDVLLDQPFDVAFLGWGWEDVEWSMRVSRRFRIDHVDNTASHLGLDTAAVVVAKAEQSPANFGRVARLHRDLLAPYPIFRAARLLAAIPLRGLWRPWLKAVALWDVAPIGVRTLAMRFYKAALYADVI